jgi:non-ribosomal peptide synthetase component F
LLRGELDAPSFKAAWQRVVERHSVLRSSFHWADSDRAVQVVHRQVETPLDELDWRGAPLDEQERRFFAYLDADRERGFVPSWAPLTRLALVRMSDDARRIVLTYHHAILDGWCMPVLFSEALSYYEAERQGSDPGLPAPQPYRDYIAWLLDQDQARSEAYWRKTLEGFRTPTPLGIDRPGRSPNGHPHARGERFERLSRDTTASLQALARSSQLTLNTLIQGAWALLLSRYSGQSDIVFGVTVSGRPAELPGAETMVGLFINTLPARVHVDENAEVLPWLTEIQTGQVAMREREQTPLVFVQDWSDVPRGQPLFESLVVFENYPVEAALAERAGSLGIESGRILERTNFPFTLMVAPGAELSLRADFDALRFDPEAVERLLGHLRTLLEELAINPSGSLAGLSMLSESEHEHLLQLSGAASEFTASGASVNLDDLSDEDLDRLIHDLEGDSGT